MTRNTRYDEGDRIKHEDYPNKVFEVYKINNASSDSPDYRLMEIGDDRLEPFDVWTKASKMEKIGNAARISDETIEDELRSQVEELANQHAAVFQSNITGQEAREGVDMIVAKFGDKIGVNGYERDSYPSTDGYKELDSGGAIPSIEEEVELGSAIDETAHKLDVGPERVDRIADRIYGDGTGMVYPVVSGRADRYTEVN